jgi:dienelactone hydrolase
MTPARSTLILAALLLVNVLAGISRAQAQVVFSPATIGGPSSGKAAELFLPKGRGPFPAMVVLHGCDGIGPHYRNWARRLRSWGYAALLVDSFGPRGMRAVCGHGRDVPPEAQAADAFRAAMWLRTRPHIAPERVGVIGFSHGGWAVLKAVLADAPPAGGPAFIVAIAYYPGCERPTAPLVTDTLILIGADDDWTPPDRCVRWTQVVDRNGHTLEMLIYPGVLHGFDTDAPLHVYIGHRLGGDPAAAADAERRVRQFLDARLAR